MKITRKQKDRYKNAYLNPIKQLWQTIRTMPIEDRKPFIQFVENLNQSNCGWLDYAAKPLLNKMISDSECYF
jgi:hypothetical protein